MEIAHYCEHCEMCFLHPHLHQCSKPNQRGGHIDNGRPPVDQLIFQEVSRNHRGSIVTYRHNLEDYMTLVEYFTLIDQPLANLIEDVLLVYDTIMVKVSLAVLMENELNGKEEEFYFPTKFKPIYHNNETQNFVFTSAEVITELIDNFIHLGSGWSIKEILNMDVIVAKYIPGYHARPEGHIKMPIQNKRGFLNIENRDEKCFQYCIVASDE